MDYRDNRQRWAESHQVVHFYAGQWCTFTPALTPPRSPELNPVENVWQFMRDNWLSNRIFKSYEDIVALCCQAWNNLIDQPWKIMSLGMRKWAHGF